MGATLGIVLLLLIMLTGPVIVARTTPGNRSADPNAGPSRAGSGIGPAQERIGGSDRDAGSWDSRYARDFELWELDR